MKPGIIWLASYPKSGNTWMRLFLDNWFRNADQPVDINNITPPACSPNDRTRFDSATLLSSSELLPEEIEALRQPVMELAARELTTPALVKVHNAYAPAFGSTVAQAAIYIIRDPRDVVASSSAYFGITIEQAVHMLGDSGRIVSTSRRKLERQLPQRVSDWSTHVRSWVDGCDVPLLVVRYEDLPGAFSEVLQFLGEPLDHARLQRVIDHSRIEELRRQEDAHGFKERVYVGRFFRQGKAGGWQTALPAEQVHRIEQAHGPIMERFGYTKRRRPEPDTPERAVLPAALSDA